VKSFRNRTRITIVLLALALLTAGVVQAAAPNLMAAFFVKGKVGLKWGQVAGAEEYLIFRKAPGEDFKQIGRSAEDRYFDTDVTPGTTYSYKIAVVEGGAELFSSQKSVSIPGDSGGFTAPSWVGIRMDQDKLFLNWDPVPGAMAYNVWRSDFSGSGYEVVGTAQGSRYVEKAGLVKGTTYYYVLTAMNSEFDETPKSEEQSIKYGISMEEQTALAAEEAGVELVPYPVELKFEIVEGSEGGVMNQPSDVFVNSLGRIYATDALNQQVICYDKDGNFQFTFGEKMSEGSGRLTDGGFLYPFTLFINAKDEVFVADVRRNDIQVFDPDGKFLRRIQVETGEGMEALRPNGLHVLDDGRLVMTDTGNHRVLVTSPEGTILQVIGEKGVETGQFIFPDELTVSPDGTICVVGPITGRIQMFSLDGTFVRTFGTIGEGPGQFGRPKGIVVDPQGLIWVSDGMSNMIQRFSFEGEVQSILGSVDDDVRFITPRGVHFYDGQLFVVQRLADKISVFNVGP
jgi:sugar lactone lactonase YvrE